ncbi:MAG: hypothetical protein ACE37F_27605 [Nannocystaceae bacterium]|nr:hypothetical protein [bacterium]
MAFSPSEDPWGTGMLVSGGLWALAFLVLLVRRSPLRPPPSGAASLMSLSAIGFIACALLGATAQPAEPAPGSASADEASAEAESGDQDASPSPDEKTPSGDEATPQPTDAAEAPEAKPTVAALPEPDPIPASGPERRAAVRKVLRDARKVYESTRDCKRVEPVGRAWKAIAALPEDTHSERVRAVVRRLEACRRQVRWTTTYAVHRKRVDARDAFVDTLVARIAKSHDVRAAVKLSGDDHERIRIGGGNFDDALVSALMTDAFKDELAGLGFESVVVARPGKTWREALEPRSESAYVDDALTPYGLEAKLTLSAG